jgi:hypothetical protein
LLFPALLLDGCCVARLLLILFTFAVVCFVLATFANHRSVVVTTAVAVTNAVANGTTTAAKAAVATAAGISWSRCRHCCR